MINLKSLYGKSVISLIQGNLEGKIEKLIADKHFKKIKFIQIKNNEKISILNTNNIYKIGKDALIIKDNLSLSENTLDYKTLQAINFDINIFTYDGNNIGTLTDININDKFIVENLIYNNDKTLSTSLILKTSDNAIICDNEDNLITNKSILKKKSFPKTKSTKLPNVKTQDTISTITMSNIPVRTLIKSNTLLGRIVTQNIYGITGEVIIKKNTYINDNTLKIAKNNLKTKELFTKSVELAHNNFN